MKLYYTKKYEDWYKIIEKTTEQCRIGEKISLVFLEKFKELSMYMIAPACMIDNVIIMATSHIFYDTDKIIEFLENNSRFKLYKCTHVLFNNEEYYVLRGSLK
jgi:AAA+ superfamily predicted ATPase